MRAKVAGLPKFIVRAMLHQVIPKTNFALEIVTVGIGERTEGEKKLIAIGRLEIKRPGRLPCWFGQLLFEGMQETKRVDKIECAVMTPIVPDKPIGNRRLGRGAFERGV